MATRKPPADPPARRVARKRAVAKAPSALRQVRKRAPDGELVAVSALDPLNLVGTVLAGEKVPRQLGGRVLYRDGIAVATFVAGKVGFHVEATLEEQHTWKRVLLREPEPGFHGEARFLDPFTTAAP